LNVKNILNIVKTKKNKKLVKLYIFNYKKYYEIITKDNKKDWGSKESNYYPKNNSKCRKLFKGKNSHSQSLTFTRLIIMIIIWIRQKNGYKNNY